MRPVAAIFVVIFATPLAAGEGITVSVCTTRHLDAKTVAGAEAVAASLFHDTGIEVAWAACEAGLEGDEATQQHWFTVRLRGGHSFIPIAGALDTLGEAFFSADDAGYLANVYCDAVETLATSKVLELKTLLGFVIAHEVGHLMLGPGHGPAGVMRQSWDVSDLQMMRQGCLKFSPAEGVRMRRVLKGNNAAVTRFPSSSASAPALRP